VVDLDPRIEPRMTAATNTAAKKLNLFLRYQERLEKVMKTTIEVTVTLREYKTYSGFG
jgi:hypothetical protein